MLCSNDDIDKFKMSLFSSLSEISLFNIIISFFIFELFLKSSISPSFKALSSSSIFLSSLELFIFCSSNFSISRFLISCSSNLSTNSASNIILFSFILLILVDISIYS